MKKLLYVLIFTVIAFSMAKSQALIWTEGFETTLPNNVPAGWSYWDNTGFNSGPDTNWTVRDSGSTVPGVNAIRTAIPYLGHRNAGVSWLTGTNGTANLADAWLVSKKIRNVPSDGLIQFWGTGGTPTLSDSLQLWVSTTDSTPAAFLANPNNYISTIAFPPNPVYASYSDYYIDLIPFAGQNVFIGFRYYQDVSSDGVFVQIDEVSFLGTVGITQNGTNIPDNFALYQNYPNPFNPTTKINFELSKSTNVKLTVFNSIGQVVMNIFDGYKPAGSYQAEFNGSSLSSGTYYYRLDTDFYTETKKMQLIK